MIDKIASLASIGSSFANVTLLQRFLSSIASVIALTVFSALMASMLVICGFYGLYLGLVRYGLDNQAAFITIALLIFLLTMASAGLTLWRLQHLREIPKSFLPPEMPVISRVGNVIHAFIDGIKTGRALD